MKCELCQNDKTSVIRIGNTIVCTDCQRKVSSPQPEAKRNINDQTR